MPDPDHIIAPVTKNVRVRLISYNIQAAIGVQTTAHYVTRVHRQFVYVKAKAATLSKIGKLIEPYDIACIQEVDLGGRRSNFSSQVEKLFEVTSFSDAAFQENRIVRRISRHGNLILSRKELDDTHDLKLPARMGGRGAIIGSYPVADGRSVTIVNLHLSLGKEEQAEQLDALADELESHSSIVICGDFNAQASDPHLNAVMARLDLKLAGTTAPTYPAWKPRQALDHILVSRHIGTEDFEVGTQALSDHLPVSVTLIL